jgi:hypothetical protein
LEQKPAEASTPGVQHHLDPYRLLLVLTPALTLTIALTSSLTLSLPTTLTIAPALTLSSLALTGPERAAVRVAQVQNRAGGIIGDLAGLELAILAVKTKYGYGVAGSKDNALSCGKTGLTQPE